jgi:hypothetical protein
MADTAVTNITWDDDNVTSISAAVGTAIVSGDTHVITPTGPLEDMVIIVRNTEGSTNTITILAGDDPPAMSSGIGNLTPTTIAATTGCVILPPLESARYLQNNGTLRINVEAGMTGYIIALQKPTVVAT